MSEGLGLPPGDPLNGSAIAGRWSFGYDMPEELGGGFVSGELLLRSDGVLLRRYGGGSYRAGQVSWKYGPWDEVSWWTGETNSQQAAAFLSRAGTTCPCTAPCPSTSPPSAQSPARPWPARHCDGHADDS